MKLELTAPALRLPFNKMSQWRLTGCVKSGVNGRKVSENRTPANVRFFVVSGQAGFGLETLKAEMAVLCLDRPLSKISIYELPFRIVQQARHIAPKRPRDA